MIGLNIFLALIGFGIFCDLAFNDGDGLSSILSAHKKNKDYAESILEELDSLYDDLTYENTPEEIQAIKSKIVIREKILEKLK